MDFLDEVSGATPSPVDLDTIVGTPLQPLTPPRATIRNRAATAAMLSDNPSKAGEQYQGLVADGENGGEGATQTYDSFRKQDNSLDMKALMGVLSDPKLSFEQKQGAVEALKSGKLLSEPSVSLMSKGLEAASKDETPEAETARLNTSDLLAQMHQSASERQALVNVQAAKGSMDGAYLSALEATFLPFATGATSYKLAKGMAKAEGRELGVWESIKAATFGAGSTKEEVRKKLSLLSPQAQVQYTKNLLEVIDKNDGFIFSSENGYQKYISIKELTEEGGYHTAEKWLDNASFLLDAIGIGLLLKDTKNVAKLSKQASVATRGVDATTPLAKASEATVGAPVVSKAPSSGYEPAKATGTPTAGAYDKRIEATQAKIATLMGDAGNVAEKGAIAELRQARAALGEVDTSGAAVKARAKELQKEGLSYKEASTKAEKEIADSAAEFKARASYLDNQIESNARASRASQEIDKLEKEVELLKQRNTPVFVKKTYMADVIEHMERNALVRQENPSSVANIIQQSNPEQARGLHEAVFKSIDDSVAEATYGVGKVQALVNDVVPQAGIASGRISAKPIDMQRNLRKDIELAPQLRKMIEDNDAVIHYTVAERERGLGKVKNDFTNVVDLVPQDNMSSFKTVGSRIKIDAVYSAKEGAFPTIQAAKDRVLLSMRKQGILDEELEFLKKDGIDYVPVKESEVGLNTQGNFLVRVKTSHELDPTDIGGFDMDKQRWNYFDRFSNASSTDTGTLTNWMVDAASIHSKRVSGAAVVTNDISTRMQRQLLTILDEFAQPLNKLPKERKEKLHGYFKEANFKRIAFDDTDLIGRGFSPEERMVARKWRDFWDSHYYLENYDLVRTYNSKGFGMFKSADAEFHVKPVIQKNQNIAKVFDPATGKVVATSVEEMDKLYDSGGHYARFYRPQELDGVMVEHMLVRNTGSEYVRKFRDSDAVLNKIDGYYQIQYKAPRWIDEITVDSKGVETGRRAVAVAGDTAEANAFKAGKDAEQNGKKYEVRSDANAVRRGSDDWYDVNSSSGRVAQRYRGRLLEDAAGVNHLGDGSYMASPVDAAIRSAQSIAGRTVTRPMIEMSEARFIEQHAKVLPSDGMGGVRFPHSIGEIGTKGGTTTKAVGDAISDFNYIKYLQNGYINSVDQTFKKAINALSETLGAQGHTRMERAALAYVDSNLGPTQLARTMTSNAFIATNVIRNWVTQPAQSLRLIAYNPVGISTGSVTRLAMEYLSNKVGVNFTKEGKIFSDFVQGTGILESIDKHNLVRGSLLIAADSEHTAVKMAKGAISLPRKIGFDTGESVNMMLHTAAVFDKFKREGKNVADIAVQREMHSMVRGLSNDMNAAGDMVYNQNWAAMVMQFAQNPHKAVLFAANRRIPWEVKARLIPADMFIWGLPIAAISSMLGGDILSKDDSLNREVIMDGALSTLVNNTLREAFGDDTAIDFSSLNQYGMDGWAKTFKALAAGDMGAIIANSPASTFLIKEDGRVREAMRNMARFLNPWRDEDRTKEETMAVVSGLANMSSGFNNMAKARMALHSQQLLDKAGAVVDGSVTTSEAVALAFGFGTQHSSKVYSDLELARSGTKAYKEEVVSVAKEIIRRYQTIMQEGLDDPRQRQAIVGEAMLAYKGDPEALGIFKQEFDRALTPKDTQVIMQFLKLSGLKEHTLTVDQIRNSSLDEERKKLLIQRLEDMKNLRSINE
jgi:hypothetical protein